MAKVNSEQGFNIRHRLVGAVVLLGIGVVFIPMILQGKGPGAVMKTDSLTEEVQEWIVGSENSKTYTSRVRPVGENAEQTALASQDQDSNSELPAQVPELVVIDDDTQLQALKDPQTDAEQQNTVVEIKQPQPEQQQAEQPQTELQQPELQQTQQVEQKIQEPDAEQTETPEPTQTASLKSENVSIGWLVQVGTFSKPENAQNLISKLNKNGFDPRYEVINTDSGQATRVWVGPYEKRVTAGRALETVKEKTGVKGFIKSYP